MSIVDIGDGTMLNIFDIRGNTEAARQVPMFGRGRIDHIGLRAKDMAAFEEIRRRLMQRGAADDFVTDFGDAVLGVLPRPPTDSRARCSSTTPTRCRASTTLPAPERRGSADTPPRCRVSVRAATDRRALGAPPSGAQPPRPARQASASRCSTDEPGRPSRTSRDMGTSGERGRAVGGRRRPQAGSRRRRVVRL